MNDNKIKTKEFIDASSLGYDIIVFATGSLLGKIEEIDKDHIYINYQQGCKGLFFKKDIIDKEFNIYGLKFFHGVDINKQLKLII